MIRVKCKKCGKLFRQTPDHQVFCSKICYHQYIKVEPQKCQYCGNLFYPSKTTRNRGKYCSRECYIKDRYNKGMQKLICRLCGKKFFRKKWRVNNEKSGLVFCGEACRRKYIKLNPLHLTGKRKIFKKDRKKIQNLYHSGLTVTEVAIKLAVSPGVLRKWMKRFKIKTRQAEDYTSNKSEQYYRHYLNKKLRNTCQLCGWNKTKCDIHHKMPLSEGGNNESENIILICPNCHRMIHNKLIKL